MGRGLRGDRLPDRRMPPLPEHKGGGMRRLRHRNGGIHPTRRGPINGSGSGIHRHVGQPHVSGPREYGGHRYPDRHVHRKDRAQHRVPAAPRRVHEGQLPGHRRSTPVRHRGGVPRHHPAFTV